MSEGLTLSISSPFRFLRVPDFPMRASMILFRLKELMNRLKGMLLGRPLRAWNFPSVIDLKKRKIVDSRCPESGTGVDGVLLLEGLSMVAEGDSKK